MALQALRDMLVICTPWRELHTRLEGESHLTISSFDVMVDYACRVLHDASVNMELCDQVMLSIALLIILKALEGLVGECTRCAIWSSSRAIMSF